MALITTSTITSAANSLMAIINPECVVMINKVDSALNKAHADHQLLAVTIDQKTPVNLEDEMCNVNFIIGVKDKKEYQEIQDKLLKLMSGVTKQDLTKPNAYTVKEI